MNTKNLTIAILALTMGMSHADVLDSEAQLQTKFGPPVEIDGWKRTYNWGNFVVVAILGNNTFFGGYFKGAVMSQGFRRIDGQILTQNDIARCLSLYGFSGKWLYDGMDRWHSRYGHAELSSDRTKLVLRAGKRR